MTGRSLNGLGIRLALVALAASGTAWAAQDLRPASTNVHLRARLDNCRIRFEHEKKGHVAFMGGSITEMNGYRPMVAEFLTKRFPETEFTFTDAGIASTCSTTGAFRLEADVLGKGPVDLFFIEFAVNDDQDAGHARRECIRGMEGIIRHTRRHNRCADIVVTYFVNPGMLETIQAGKTPLTIGSHEAVAEHYGVPTVNLAKEVADRITAAALTWKQFGGTHPAPSGNAICTRMIEDLLGRAWSKPLPERAKQTPHPMPPEPLDPLHYGNGRFIDPSRAAAGDGWTLGVPDWSKLKGSCRSRFAKTPMLCADRPGAELTLEFTGTAVGAYVLAGPDAGVAEARVDGGTPKQVDLYHRFSKGLHYPRTVMLATDLKPGVHTLRLRIAETTSSSGHAMRILQFAAN
ncbi:MAG TPA: GDSL-type esterase/lipase family protein [Phycisphaerae bacterium]|nr:GDSL-type esterase/lipase family protein [Phycisphaerae bacterium]